MAFRRAGPQPEFEGQPLRAERIFEVVGGVGIPEEIDEFPVVRRRDNDVRPDLSSISGLIPDLIATVIPTLINE